MGTGSHRIGLLIVVARGIMTFIEDHPVTFFAMAF
jgi:hypothetical protein